jgi:iron(III) transport system substrate-binding protein
MKGKELTRGFLALSFLLASQLFFTTMPAHAAEGRLAWQIEWERTVEAAKKEGQLVLYASEGYEEVFRDFRKKYPEIKVTLGIIYGAESTSRFMAERRAGKYLIDLYVNGNTTAFSLYNAKNLAPLKPALLLPEVMDQSKWWQGRHHYVDAQEEYIFAFNGQARVEVNFNTNLVSPQEMKSYWDLLNPKWKGKMVGFDPRHPTTGTTMRFLYYHPELGPKYISRLLTEMDMTFSRDGRQMADWLANGKFAISMFASPDRLDLPEAKKQGLPVAWFDSKSFKEGAALTAGPGGVALIDRAPHPNAAKVGINWLLSREGQTAFQNSADRTNSADSLRIDIPKEKILPESRRIEGARYVITDRADWMDMTPIIKLISETMKAGK